MAAFTVSMKNLLVKMNLRLFQPLSVVTTMVPTLLRQSRRSLQIKKIITDGLCVLQFAAQPKHIIINNKSVWLLGHLRHIKKRSNNWPVMSFTHGASEIRIYRVSSAAVTSLMAYSQLGFFSKTKRIKSKETFLRTSFLKLQIIILVQRRWSCMPTH